MNCYFLRAGHCIGTSCFCGFDERMAGELCFSYRVALVGVRSRICVVDVCRFLDGSQTGVACGSVEADAYSQERMI